MATMLLHSPIVYLVVKAFMTHLAAVDFEVVSVNGFVKAINIVLHRIASERLIDL